MKARHYPLVALVVLCESSCGNSSPAPSQSAKRQAAEDQVDLGETLERIRGKHALLGLAAAVIQGERPVEAAVVGARRLGSPDRLQLADRFHIASCTKSMTATLAAILVEQGRLQWTSRLVDILPELGARIRPEYRTATLEQLLSHAAGFPAYTQFGPERLEELKSLPGTPTEQRLAFLTQVLSSEPPNRGTGDAAYSNAGYTAVAVMLERVSDQSWEQLIRTRLFQPLGLTEVGFGWPATEDTPDQPRGHLRLGGRLMPQPLDDSYLLPVALWPAGAVNSSIGDLARYTADHLRGLRGEKALLSGATYQRLHRTLNRKAAGFTLGWGVRSDPQWGTVHYGAGSGGTFFTRILIVPDHNVAIVVASNSGDAAAATREVIDTILRQIGALPAQHRPKSSWRRRV
jgi:CubicO group peptidase (beta-lactamase class C family)